MKSRVMKSWVFVLSFTLVFSMLLGGCSSVGEEANYPEKPVQFIMAFGAGGGTDRMFRGFQQKLQNEIGEELIPVYKTGAGGIIGWTEIVNAKPDGYSVGIFNMPTATATIVSGDANFGIDDFIYLGSISYEPPIMVVASDNKLGIKSMEDLIEYAKANPGKVSVANTGTGGDEFVSSKLIQKHAGVEFNDVPFSSSAEAATAVLGEHVVAQMTSIHSVVNYVDQGQMDILAVGSPERQELMPDVPTFKEEGIDFTLGGYMGVIAPLDFPEDAKEIWIKAIKNLMEDEEYIESAKEDKLNLKYLGPEEFKNKSQELLDQYNEIFEEFPW